MEVISRKHKKVKPKTSMKQPRKPFYFDKYTPQAGHPDWKKLHAEAMDVVDEVRGTMEKPGPFWEQLKRRLSSYSTAVRNFFLNRSLEKKGREDLRPLYFIWTLLRHCNFACGYCDDHQGKKYPHLPKKGTLDTEDAIRLLEIMRTRTPSLYFAGGEPMIRKDLPILTRKAKELNYYPIIINTNGSLIERNLRKEEWRSWLADMDMIIVSLDALDLQLLKKMWVFRKPEDVLKGLMILRELSEEMQFKLMVNCVIQPGLTDEAKAVLDFANDMGIWFTPVPVNIGPSIDMRLHDEEGYWSLTKEILERKKQGMRITGSYRLNRRLLHSEKLECRNTIKPHIDHDGTLIWPCKAAVNVSPKHIQVLDFEDVDSLYEHARLQISPDSFQGDGKEQCGANCNWAQNYSTDAYLHGLRHPSSLFSELGSFLKR